MLLTTLPSAVSIGSLAFRRSSRVYATLSVAMARRRMATGAPVVNPSLKETKEPIHKGVEGPHISADRFLRSVEYGPRTVC